MQRKKTELLIIISYFVWYVFLYLLIFIFISSPNPLFTNVAMTLILLQIRNTGIVYVFLRENVSAYHILILEKHAKFSGGRFFGFCCRLVYFIYLFLLKNYTTTIITY